MRIGVLGGGGDMGSRAVEVLAGQPDVDEVVLLDRDQEAAHRVAAAHASARPVRFDAEDRSGTRRALEGLDTVASALGPFYRFEVPLAQAAIDVGVPYVSICDDHSAAAAVLALDPVARERGVPVVTGLGWTPGLTNLAARRIADDLGGLDAVRVFWGCAASDSSGRAVIMHVLYVIDGFVPMVRDGLVEQVRAGTGLEPVHFPEPLGEVVSAYLGHPEPVTLPRFLPGLRRVEVKGGLAENYLNVLGRALNRTGLTRTHRRRQRLAGVLGSVLPALERIGPTTPCSAWRVEGSFGERSAGYWGAGRMRDLTGVPLGLGALLLARGEYVAAGVVAPEAEAFPDQALWKLLRGHGVTIEPVPELAHR